MIRNRVATFRSEHATYHCGHIRYECNPLGRIYLLDGIQYRHELK